MGFHEVAHTCFSQRKGQWDGSAGTSLLTKADSPSLLLGTLIGVRLSMELSSDFHMYVVACTSHPTIHNKRIHTTIKEIYNFKCMYRSLRMSVNHLWIGERHKLIY